jgi:hypothetical protein
MVELFRRHLAGCLRASVQLRPFALEAGKMLAVATLSLARFLHLFFEHDPVHKASKNQAIHRQERETLPQL